MVRNVGFHEIGHGRPRQHCHVRLMRTTFCMADVARAALAVMFGHGMPVPNCPLCDPAPWVLAEAGQKMKSREIIAKQQAADHVSRAGCSCNGCGRCKSTLKAWTMSSTQGYASYVTCQLGAYCSRHYTCSTCINMQCPSGQGLSVFDN